MLLSVLLVVFALALAQSSPYSRQLAPLLLPENADIIPDEYLIMFKEDQQSTEENTSSILSELPSARLIHRYSNGFAAAMSQEDLLLVRQYEQVALVEANQVVYALGMQMNPPSWGLARIYQRQFRTRNVYKFPDSAGEGVDVYIIDTGVNTKHEDFEGRAKWGFTAPAGDADEDGNGHGTHVASTVAGLLYGVAKKANIIAVKVLRSSGFGTLADVIKGVEWAVTQAQSTKRPSLSNMSLGSGRSRVLDAAVKQAILSVAAGNSNADACFSSPSAVEEAVTVGSTQRDDARSYFSNFGKCVDIFAPGTDITGAWIGSTSALRTISGTSMASPHVAGVMALVLGESKSLSPQELKDKILELATDGVLTGLPANTVNKLLNNNAKELVIQETA